MKQHVTVIDDEVRGRSNPENLFSEEFYSYVNKLLYKTTMEFLLDWGYVGLFAGAFLAATVIPFSSDALLIGVLALGASVPVSLFWATLGNWLGGLTSYWIGYSGKWEWIQKWFRVSKEKLEKQQSVVNKYGSWLAFFTWLPFIGDLFAIALGFYRIKFFPTALFMLIGKFTRFLLWAFLFIEFKGYFIH